MCGEMKLQAISGLRKGCEPLAYVTVPKDLTKIKSKMLFGLTKRQLVCFGSAALVGVPLFFLSKGSMGTTPAALCMILVMLPFFLFALYEKNGQTPEALLGHLIQCKFTRPKKRVYQTNNAYSALEKQAELERAVGRIASGAGKRGKGRRRLTRQERKQIEAVIRQAKGDGKNHTVQASLPFRNMHPDGLCRLDDGHFSKTIAYADVSYRLAGPDDQRDIFERLCDFYNGYDPSIGVQMTLSSRHKAGGGDLFRMAAQGDDLDGIRAEASGILQTQYERGSNGYVKSKYVTLTIEAENIQAAGARFSRIEADTLNRFKVMGAAAKVLDGKERLALLHGLLHPRGEPFAFEWDWLAPSGLSVKDFIAPSSFEFGETRRFRMGEMYGAVSFLQILAPEIQDRILTDFMDVEGNLLITMHVRGINQNEAIKMVKRKITDLDAMKIQEQKKAARSGYDLDILPSDLSTYGGAAKNLLQDLQSRNERMFNMTFLMLHLAPTKQKLEIAVSQSASVAQTHNCILTRLDFQQEDGLVSSLPLGLNRIQIERSLTTSALAVFVPFVTQELFMGGDAMYYGLNALSGNMILLDRKQSRCPNGLVFGTPGSGKSMSCKREITYVMLTTKDNVIICDPEDEYSPLVNRLGGQVIRLSPNSRDYVNPLDINLNYSEEENPLALKSDFVLSFCELIMGSKTGLEAIEKTVIDRAVQKIYQPYFADPRPENMPILSDLMAALTAQHIPEADRVAQALDLYVNGSLNFFNHRTTVDIRNRLVCFDIKGLGKNLKKPGMLIVQDAVWNTVTVNRSIGRATWYFVDEFHLLLKEEQTAAYSAEIWKRFRKWGGVPTGATQNPKDLLSSPEIENILENSDFIYLLNLSAGDRKLMTERLNISAEQLAYVTNADPGSGLLFFQNVILPFKDEFPKDTELYRLLTTKPSEVAHDGENG